MSRKLPPLNALRAFEAAARHLSFTRAANELHVTQAAISHQVKGLEEWFGAPLFKRLNRNLKLTEQGAALLPELQKAFDHIAEATASLRHPGAEALTITTMPSFGAKWLLPRLARFEDRHPGIDVRLSTTTVLVDFRQQDCDLAIRFGKGRWPGLRAEFLMQDSYATVCSPSLEIASPADLARVTLLHDDVWDISDVGWADWLRAAGIDGVNVNRGPRFSDSSLLLQSAMDGRGVALTRSSLVLDDVRAGRLVQPFDLRLPTEEAYYLVAPAKHFARPKVAAFREWLLEEVAAFVAAEIPVASPLPSRDLGLSRPID
jgi:LysR family transcriptional regulator, glycine cleavage system transcriptional activator